MATIEKLWRLNENITMPENEQEVTIYGPFTIGLQPYNKGIVTKTDKIILTVYDSKNEPAEIYSSETGWVNYTLRIWDFNEGVTVADSTKEYFETQAIEIEPVVTAAVKYKEENIVSIGPGRTATLNCAQQVMSTDLEIAAAPLCHEVVIPTKEPQEKIVPPHYGGFHSFRVEPIPPQYIVPQGQLLVEKNGEQDVTAFQSIMANIVTPTEELTVDPLEEEQIFNPPEGKHYSTVTVKRIPEEYIVPKEHLEINENVENKDIREYATLTVNTMEAIKGVKYECIAGTDIEMGSFVEFLINYGSGEFSAETVSDIHLYQVNQEKMLIDYKLYDGQRQVVGLYLVGNLFYLSDPITYGADNAETYDFTSLDANTAVCLWTTKENFGYGQTQTKVFIQSIEIQAYPMEGITLVPKNQHLVYTGNPGAEVYGAAITKLNYNSVFITMKIDNGEAEDPIYYSVIKSLNNVGNWNTGIGGNAGYDYSNTNRIIALSEDKILCSWLKDTVLSFGLLVVDSENSEIETRDLQTINNISSFNIKDLQNYNYFPLLTKDIDNKLEIRTLDIGGTTITIGEPTIIAENVTGPSGFGAIAYYETVVLYSRPDGKLATKFFSHYGSDTSELSSMISSSLANLIAQEGFDIGFLFYNNNIIAYVDQSGASRYAQLVVTTTQTGVYMIDFKEEDQGTYVYPTTSNAAIVGVATTSAKATETVMVVRPS